MEEFDLVDDNDIVIGTTNEETAHKKGQLHRVVAVYVFTTDDQLYVQQHPFDHKLDHSIGGHVRKSETYDDAAKREAFEELAVIQPLTPIAHLYADETGRGNNFRHMFGLYECHVKQGWSFKPNDEIKVIIPMYIEDIINEMNNYPDKFTLGFLNTMNVYIKQKELPYSLNLI